jgi:hypothetical protein
VLVAASPCNPEKFCTLPDRVQWYDGSRATFLRQQDDGMISSPSDMRIAASDFRDIRDPHVLRYPHDLHDRLY